MSNTQYHELMKLIDYNPSDILPVVWETFPDGILYEKITDFGVFCFTFSKSDLTVYEIEIVSSIDYQHGKFHYRWINEDYLEAYKATHITEELDFYETQFGYRLVDLESYDDMIRKSKSIMSNEVFDTRVDITLDLDEDLQLELFRLAHSKDITFNQLIEELLILVCNEFESRNRYDDMVVSLT